MRGFVALSGDGAGVNTWCEHRRSPVPILGRLGSGTATGVASRRRTLRQHRDDPRFGDLRGSGLRHRVDGFGGRCGPDLGGSRSDIALRCFRHRRTRGALSARRRRVRLSGTGLSPAGRLPLRLEPLRGHPDRLDRRGRGRLRRVRRRVRAARPRCLKGGGGGAHSRALALELPEHSRLGQHPKPDHHRQAGHGRRDCGALRCAGRPVGRDHLADAASGRGLVGGPLGRRHGGGAVGLRRLDQHHLRRGRGKEPPALPAARHLAQPVAADRHLSAAQLRLPEGAAASRASSEPKPSLPTPPDRRAAISVASSSRSP